MKYSSRTKTYTLVIALFLIVLAIAFSLNNKGTDEKIHYISLYKDRMDPNELIIKLGDKVQFNSKDGLSHSIALGKGNDYDHLHEHTEETGTSMESGSIGPEEGYLVSFERIGTYFFHDHYDANIFVTILVYE